MTLLKLVKSTDEFLTEFNKTELCLMMLVNVVILDTIHFLSRYY